jgi:hypothetical protein
VQLIQFQLVIFQANKIRADKKKLYQKLIHVVLFVIARDYLDDMLVTTMIIRTRVHQLRTMLQRLELMQVMARNNKIRGTRLEVTIQQVDTVQAVHRMYNELDILRIQGLENMLERSFNIFLILLSYLIHNFWVKVENLEVAM